MASKSPLSSLPAELLVLILSSCDSPRDLFAAISASPVFLQVFLRSPGPILVTILRQSISPVAFHHAVAALTAPAPKKGISESTRQVRLWDFLNEYFSDPAGLDKLDNLVLDGLDARAFAKLHARISRFSKDMIDGYFDLLYSSGEDDDHPATPTSPQPLSSSERARLERAFYRYELYSRCFPVDYENLRLSLAPAQAQYDKFISRLLAWEVEEMSCVHQYFESKMGDIVTRMEQEIVAKVKEHKVAERDESPHEDASDLCSFESVELEGLSLFSANDYEWRRSILGYLVSLGAEFLDSILFCTKQSLQRDLLRHNECLNRDFLPEAIMYGRSADRQPLHGEDEVEGEQHQQLEEETQIDKPQLPGGGWVRYRRPDYEHQNLDLASTHIIHWPTRRLGYLFWDRSRLETWPVGTKLREAAEMSATTVIDLFAPWEDPDTEEQLEGIVFPQQVMDEIVRDYASKFDSRRNYKAMAEDHGTASV